MNSYNEKSQYNRFRNKRYKNANELISAYESAKQEIEEFYQKNPIQDYASIWDVLNHPKPSHYKKVRFEYKQIGFEKKIRNHIIQILTKKSLRWDDIRPIIARDGTIKIDNWHAFYLHPLQNFREFDRRNEYEAHFFFWFVNKTFINYRIVYDVLSTHFCSKNYKNARKLQKLLKTSKSSEESENLTKELEQVMLLIDAEIDKLLYKYRLKKGEFRIELPNKPKKYCGLYVAKWEAYDNYMANLDGNFFKEDRSIFERPMTLKQYMNDKGF